jgi:hypothetical protein
MRWNTLLALVLIPALASAASSRKLQRTVPVTVDGASYDLRLHGEVTPHLDAPAPHVTIEASTPVSGLAPAVDRALRSLSVDEGECGNAFEVVNTRPLASTASALKVRAEVRATVRECVDVPEFHGLEIRTVRRSVQLARDNAWVEVTLRPSVKEGVLAVDTDASIDFGNGALNAAARLFRLDDRVATEARDALQDVLKSPRPEELGGAVLVDLRVADGKVHASATVPVTNESFLDLMDLLLE